MSIPGDPGPAMAVLSVLSARMDEMWPGILARVTELFGPACHVSPDLPFAFTHYYDAELGTPIVRRMLGFSRLVPQDSLAGAKLATNELETDLARPDGLRTVNLDPGLLTQERLVLATGKNFGHRVYLGRGIFADLTLVFRHGSWQTLAWTFPDYRSPELQAELTAMRGKYRAILDGKDPTPQTT